MADNLFIDWEVPGGSLFYSSEFRNTSGSEKCYATLKLAIAAWTTGDAIRYRDSIGATNDTYTEDANSITTFGKPLTWGPFEDEDVTVTMDGNNSIALNLNDVIVTDIGAVDFKVIAINSDAGDILARFATAGATITSTGGKFCLSGTGTLLRYPQSGTLVLDNLKLGNRVNTAVAEQDCSVVLNDPEFIDGFGYLQKSGGGIVDVTMNRPICIGTIATPYVKNLDSNSTFIINDPLFIGCAYANSGLIGELENSNGTNGTMSVVTVAASDPIVGPSVMNRQAWITYGTNITKDGSIKTTEFVTGLGSDIGQMSLVFFDSGLSQTYIPQYITASGDNSDAPLSWFPDDAPLLATDPFFLTACQNWGAANLELGTSGISGSDDWSAETLPFQFEYTGAGAGEIVISSGGDQWEVFSNSISVATYDTSVTGNEQFFNKNIDGVLRKIDVLANWSVRFETGTPILSAAGWDDAFTAIIIANDTYTAPSSFGVLSPLMPIDADTRFDTDVNGAVTLHEIEGLPAPVSMLWVDTDNNELNAPGFDYYALAANNGFTSTVGQYTTTAGQRGMQQPIGSAAIKYQRSMAAIDTTNFFKGDVQDYLDLASDALREAQIRESMDVLSTWNFAIGGHLPAQFPHDTSASPLAVFTGDEIDWILNEGILNDISFVRLSAAGGGVATLIGSIPRSFIGSMIGSIVN